MIATADGTALSPGARAWAGRRGEAWALGYWASIAKPNRALLLRALARVEPFASVVELGCGAAPNLRLIQARYPGTACYGIDVNAQMLLTAWDQAEAEGWGAHLDLEQDDVATCAVPPADVVLSSYALAYVAPDAVGAVVARMCVAAARAVIFLEPCDDAPVSRRVSDPAVHRVDEWAHPYAGLVPSVGWALEHFPLAPPLDRLNGCWLARRRHMFSYLSPRKGAPRP